MCKTNENLKKICNLYASDWHMLTTILAYLKDKDLTYEPVAFITEKSLKNDFEFLLSKLNLSNNTQNKLKNIPWYANTLNLGISKNSTYIIKGSASYIDTINKYFYENNNQNNITLINCYPILDQEFNISKITREHDKILNTSGIKNISEIFCKV